MAAITYSTVPKTAALERINDSDDDKFRNPDEHGARVRRAEISYTNGTGGAVSDIVLGWFERAATILKIEILSDDAVADINFGTTPKSLPVDTVNDLGDAIAITANTAFELPLAINASVDADDLVLATCQTGDFANGAVIKGNIYYVDGT